MHCISTSAVRGGGNSFLILKYSALKRFLILAPGCIVKNPFLKLFIFGSGGGGGGTGGWVSFLGSGFMGFGSFFLDNTSVLSFSLILFLFFCVVSVGVKGVSSGRNPLFPSFIILSSSKTQKLRFSVGTLFLVASFHLFCIPALVNTPNESNTDLLKNPHLTNLEIISLTSVCGRLLCFAIL